MTDKKHSQSYQSGMASFRLHSKATWDFIVKYRVVLLILIPIVLSIFLRMQPAELPATDRWAENNVNSYYQNQIASQIAQQYPNLPDTNRNILIQTELEKVYATQGDEIAARVEQLSNEFKGRFKDEDGQTYLIAIDPYVFYRQTKNYVNLGMPGEIEIDGVSYDVLRSGQNLREQPPLFHPWFMAKLHKIISIFKPDISVMGSVFLFPVIVCTLAVIPAFFLARKIGGDFGGLFAGVITAVHPAVLGRTTAGFSDTDSYNLLFPLLIAWLFIEAFDAKDIKKKVIMSALSGLSIGVYSLAWGGWWYAVDFLVATIIGYIVLSLIKERQNIREMLKKSWKKSPLNNSLLTSGFFLAFSAVGIIAVSVFFSKLSFTYSLQLLPQFITQPLAFTQYKAVALTDIWPNVLTTVAELNLASSNQVINQLGGRLFFALAIFSMVLIVFSKEKLTVKRAAYLGLTAVWIVGMLWLREHVPLLLFLVMSLLPAIVALFLTDSKDSLLASKYGLLVIIWFAATFYAAMRGMRFSALMIPGFALTLGAGVGIFYTHAVDWMSRAVDLNKSIVRVVAILMLLLLLVNPIKGGYNTSLNEIPSMNDAWYESLTAIRDDSEDSIITSWWDFGHWFTAISERRVTFDGGSQGKRIHWVGKTLLTDNEDEAIGILRMLNCDQENAYTKAVAATDDKLFAIDMLYDAFVLDKDEARQLYLEGGLSEEEADDLLVSTHCEPMQQYYIVSEDMVGKSGVWAHFGSWDFTRGAMWNKVRPMDAQEGIATLRDEFELSQSTAEQYYYEIQTTDADRWVSPWPSFASGIGACSLQGTKLNCATGLSLDTESGIATVSTQQGTGQPHSLVYVNNDNEFVENAYENAATPFSAALFTKDGRPHSVFMDPRLAKSMFTRLFFFGGEGLDHFELMSHKRQITGGDIYVYRVIWDVPETGDDEDTEE